jgi:hypothetical protein
MILVMVIDDNPVDIGDDRGFLIMVSVIMILVMLMHDNECQSLKPVDKHSSHFTLMGYKLVAYRRCPYTTSLSWL